MLRLLSMAIQCVSSIIFILPAMLILQYAILKQADFKKFMLVLIFAFYSMAVFSVVGLPTAYALRVEFSFNFMPLIDIVNSPVAYVKNTILNIILFMPMGFLLPVIWEEYRSMKKTVFMGLAISIIIEVLQIFTFRLTDIDDLLTNTLGAFLGYYMGKMFSFQLPWKISVNAKGRSMKYEPIIILTIIFMIGFFLQPLVSNAIWDIVLSSAWWESIK